MDPPDVTLAEVGRVAMRSAQMDYYLAAMHCIMTGGKDPEVSLESCSGSVMRSQIRRQASAGVVAGDLRKKVLARVEQHQELSDARGRLVHGYLVLVWNDSAGAYEHRQRHARSGTEEPLDAPAMFELALRIGGWNAGVQSLLFEVIASTGWKPSAD